MRGGHFNGQSPIQHMNFIGVLRRLDTWFTTQNDEDSASCVCILIGSLGVRKLFIWCVQYWVWLRRRPFWSRAHQGGVPAACLARAEDAVLLGEEESAGQREMDEGLDACVWDWLGAATFQ